MNEKTAQKLLKQVKESYSDISEDFHKTRKNDWKEFQLFLEYIKDGQYLVDLGCGNGRFYHFLQKHRHTKYIGIDNNEKLLKKAYENFKAKFIEGNLLEIPVESEEADVAILIASLHHIPSRELRQKAIQEVKRILKKNGTLIITVWNLFQPKYKKYIWWARLKSILSLGKYDLRDTFIPWGKSGVDRYYYAFTPAELRSMLKSNGFEIIAEHIANNLVFICRKK